MNHLRKTELFTTGTPSNLFEYMGRGLTLLRGVAGASAEIVELEQMGQVFESENAQLLVAG
jgi:hypothetical protein